MLNPNTYCNYIKIHNCITEVLHLCPNVGFDIQLYNKGVLDCPIFRS